MTLRIAFAGTPAFAACALQALHDAGLAPVLVLTQPDRPAGRGLKLQPSAVKQLAQALHLPVLQPAGLRLDGKWALDAQATQAALLAARIDTLVVAAYGLLLPPWVLDLPLGFGGPGCINIHASLLPRWRGAAPIHRALEAGDVQTGISIMKMDAGLDTGAVIAAKAIAINADDTQTTLHDRLAELGARMICGTLRDAQSGPLAAQAQPLEGVTYANKVDKAEARIDWGQPAAEIERRARAFDPFPGTSFQCAEQSVKLWRGAVRADVVGQPGTVVAVDAQRLSVACGQGGLDLLQLQRPGARRVEVAEFLRAQSLVVGQRLG